MADKNNASVVPGLPVDYTGSNLVNEVATSDVPSEASDFWKQRQQQLQLLDKNLEIENQQKQNNADFLQSNYAQNPSPTALWEGSQSIPSVPIGNESFTDIKSQLNQGIVNAFAGDKNDVLTPVEESSIRGVPVPIKEQDKGHGSSFKSVDNNPAVEGVPTATTEQSSSVKTSTQNPFGLAEQAINVGERAGLELAAAKQKMAESQLLHEASYQKKMEDLQNGFNVQYQEKIDDLNSNVKELRAMAGDKIIPAAYLARQDTQAAIMTGLSVALGALSGAYTGSSQNIGLEMVNKAIDRDVEAQRFNLDTKQRLKRDEMNANESLLAKMRQKFGDDTSAVLATKISLLASAEAQFNSDLNKKNGFARLSNNAAALNAKSQLASQRMVYESQLRAEQEKQYSMNEMLKGADINNLSTEQAQLLYGAKEAEKYVQGFGKALSKEDKKAFQENYGESRSSLEALDKLLSMDMNKLSPEKRAEVATELNLLTGKMRLAVLGPGAMTEKEYDRLIDTLGDPNAIIAFPGTQKKKLQTVRQRLQSQQDANVKLYFGKQKFEELQKSKGKINFK